MKLEIAFSKYRNSIRGQHFFKQMGRITHVNGFLMKGYVPGVNVGSLCEVYSIDEQYKFIAEVVGFEDRHVLLMSLGELSGVGLGSKIVVLSSQSKIPVGKEMIGRVIDALGQPLDDKGEIDALDEIPIYKETVNPLERSPIREKILLGVRAIDGLLTLGKGQRIGILAGSGVGKSMLLGMIAKKARADLNVIALIGERGREVREFIEDVLGPEGLKKSIIVVATSDQSPLLRTRGAFVASALAEYFCQQGKDVLLFMDSVTRFAMAQREIGLNVGEPPTTKGYTPSVFSLMPKLLERAGNFEGKGSVTGLYSVLVEGEDMEDPIADAVRSIVDGHVVLTRRLAQRGHFPAIDILQSNSRVMHRLVSEEQMNLAQDIRSMLAEYQDAEDLIQIGAYKEGTRPELDRAIRLHDSINQFLRQRYDEEDSQEDVFEKMLRVVNSGNGAEF
ncbi:MAG: FliI/YscN family ATPase [Bdellovibrio sp.]|nr:MAG: FliI/YscN family ATPase [Bdellovibrio sp.]